LLVVGRLVLVTAMRSSLRSGGWLALASLLLLLLVSSASPSSGQTAPPRPNSGFGMPYSQVWGAGSFATAGSNHLNSVGAASDGSGGSTDCSWDKLKKVYHFNVLENYQQLMTFFPDTCTDLRVRITNIPRSARRHLGQTEQHESRTSIRSNHVASAHDCF
jgi:hypothetical protein